MIGGNCYSLALALEKQGQRKEAILYAQRAIDIYIKLRRTSEVEEAQAILKRCQEDLLM